MLTDGLRDGRFQLSGWVVAEDRDTPFDGSDQTANPLQERTRIRVYMVTGDVRIADLFGVQVTGTIPDVTRSAIVQRPTSTLNFSETFRGVGDTSAIAWRRFVTSTGWNLTLNAGVSLPTGKTEQPKFRGTDDTDSLIPASRLQRGSGTFDPLMGISANKVVSRLFPPGTRIFLTGAARIPLTENKFGLRTGSSWEIGAGGSREIKFHWLVAIARISWLHREQDVFEGVPVLVGGGDWIAVAPSAAVNIGPVTVQAEIRIPVYRSLANRQLDSSRTFQLGFVWAAF